MDRHTKRLIESILSGYNRRSLNENIFTKLGDLYDEPEGPNMGKIYNDSISGVVTPLIKSGDREDIIYYFIEKFKLTDILRDIVTITMEYIAGRSCNIEYIERWREILFVDLAEFLATELKEKYKQDNILFGTNYNGNLNIVLPIAGVNKTITIEIISDNFKDGEIIDMEAELGGIQITKGLKFRYENNELGKLICGWEKPYGRQAGTLATKPKIKKALTDYNAKQDLFGDKFDNFLRGLVEKTFNVDRLAEELFCDEKVYKVVEKDIQRQAKLLGPRGGSAQLGGFDKIENPAKMVARLAATFICADKMNIHDVELKVTDDMLIRMFSLLNYTYGNRFNCENLLTRIRKFSEIHLKDVVATYLKYKDDPKIQGYCAKYC